MVTTDLVLRSLTVRYVKGDAPSHPSLCQQRPVFGRPEFERQLDCNPPLSKILNGPNNQFATSSDRLLLQKRSILVVMKYMNAEYYRKSTSLLPGLLIRPAMNTPRKKKSFLFMFPKTF